MGGPIGNKHAVGHGRPPIHTDPRKVEALIADYFEWIQGEEGEKEVTDGYDDEGKPIKVMVNYWIRRPEPPTIEGSDTCRVGKEYEYKNIFAQNKKLNAIKLSDGISYVFTIGKDKITNSKINKIIICLP